MRHLLNTLYVMTPQSYLRTDNGNVVVEHEGKVLCRVPLHLLEGMVLFGSLGMSPALMGECAQRGIGVSFLGMSGKFLARVVGEPTGNVLLRRAQYRMADDSERSLAVAKRFVVAKVRNQRTVLRRFQSDHADAGDGRVALAMETIDALLGQVPAATTRDELMGLEGKAADVYFSVFDELVVQDTGFVFGGRSRRPPRDELNALLSLFYSLLAHDMASACNTVGLDPYVGFFHVDRPGRLSLALDAMEELRAYLVDRFVLSIVNRRQVSTDAFIGSAETGFELKDEERKRLIGLWQSRKQEEVTHPFLREKVPLGLLPYVQVQLLVRYVRGELDDYPAFVWR